VTPRCSRPKKKLKSGQTNKVTKTVNVLVSSPGRMSVAIDFPCWFRSGVSGKYVMLVDEKHGFECNGSFLRILSDVIITQDMVQDLQMAHKYNAKREYYRCVKLFFCSVLDEQDMVNMLDKVIEELPL